MSLGLFSGLCFVATNVLYVELYIWCDRGVNSSDVRGVAEEGTLEYWGNLTSHRKTFQRSLLPLTSFTTFTLPHHFSFWPALSFQHDCSVSTLSALHTALTIVGNPRQLRVAVMSSRVGDKQLAQTADCEGSLQKGAEAILFWFYHNSFLRCLTFQILNPTIFDEGVKKQASHILSQAPATHNTLSAWAEMTAI